MTAATTAPTFDNMTERVFAVNQANGWFEEGRHFDDDIALLHSEVSEMFEAYRDWGFEDMTDLKCKRSASDEHLCKPQGFGSECADVLVRLLDSRHRHPGQLKLPWANLSEVDDHPDFDPFHSTLTVGGHIKRLHILISRISPTPGNRNFGGTLAYLVAWCRHLEIDLQFEFERKLEFNATRGHKHGGKLV